MHYNYSVIKQIESNIEYMKKQRSDITKTISQERAEIKKLLKEIEKQEAV